jgi:N6-adenosine-specific RNA methylase IME4
MTAKRTRLSLPKIEPNMINESQPKSFLVQRPSIVRNLDQLISSGVRFSTVYADPPWDYDNTASRGAAANHYATLDLETLMNMPIAELCADNAHLHLWTTNAFLWDAAKILEAWGFAYKSCFVWVKPQMGMGNYWRVSHEFLLLGVRGRLPFLDNTKRSWLANRRRRHSEKPFAVRELIEKVSPGPYLELFGRAEIPNSQWTVFGNQVERRLF